MTLSRRQFGFWFKRLLLIMVVANLSACLLKPEEQHILNHDYASAVQAIEKEGLENIIPDRLSSYCIFSNSLQDIGRLKKCVAEYDRRLALNSEDWYYALEGSYFGGRSALESKIENLRAQGKHDEADEWSMKVYFKDDRARSQGDYDKLVGAAKSVQSRKKFSDENISRNCKKGKESTNSNRAMDLLYCYGDKGIDAAANGSVKEAKRYIKKIDLLDKQVKELCEAPHANSKNKRTRDAFLSGTYDFGITSCIISYFSFKDLYGQGPIFHKLGQHKKALPYYRQAFKYQKIQQKRSSEVPFVTIPAFSSRAHSMYGAALFRAGQLNEAKQIYQTLIANTPTIRTDRLAYQTAMLHMATVADKANKPGEAIEYLLNAVESVEEARSTANEDKEKIGFVHDKQEIYRYLIELLIKSRRINDAFEFTERAKSRALVDLLASKKDLGKPAAEEKIKAASSDDKTDQVSNFFSSLLGKPTTQARTVKTTQETDNKQKQLKSLISVTTAGYKEIQARLDSDTTLLEYYYHKDKFFVFVVTSNRIHVEQLNAKGLNELVFSFRTALIKRQGSKHKRTGKALYKRLIKPVSRLIKTKQLIVVPHSALHYLPFNALYSGKDYLIDKYTFRMLPSASVMQFLKKRSNQPKELLVLGNPDLGKPEFDLPGAQIEAKSIVKNRTATKVLLRKQATETVIKTTGDQYKQLHFATHGKFNSDKPLSSGLLLAKDDKNDGTLTAGELYEINLNANLVTLSACETGLGKAANGDDVIGLNRGFLFAGVSSIVSSLWPVADNATKDMMIAFYKYLNTNPKAEALRLAQLDTRKKYPEPVFWASFQLTGSN